MTLEETIQACFDHFPSLFQTREEVLDHLFSVIGNGYDWVNGELLSDNNHLPINPLGPDGKAKQYKPWTYKCEREDMYDFLLKKDKRLTTNLASIYGENLEDKFLSPKPNDNDLVPRKFNIYPPSRSYSNMFIFPKNIKPDWKNGVKEFFEYIIDNVPEDATLGSINDKEYPVFSVILSKQDIIKFYETEFGKR
jgi:hypothetical protein